MQPLQSLASPTDTFVGLAWLHDEGGRLPTPADEFVLWARVLVPWRRSSPVRRTREPRTEAVVIGLAPYAPAAAALARYAPIDADTRPCGPPATLRRQLALMQPSDVLGMLCRLRASLLCQRRPWYGSPATLS